METFLLQEIAKSLTLTHNRLQAIKIKSSYSQLGLSYFLLNDHQSIGYQRSLDDKEKQLQILQEMHKDEPKLIEFVLESIALNEQLLQ